MWNELHRILGVDRKPDSSLTNSVPEAGGLSSKNEAEGTPAEPGEEPRPEGNNEPAPAGAPGPLPCDNPPPELPQGEVEPLSEEFESGGQAIEPGPEAFSFSTPPRPRRTGRRLVKPDQTKTPHTPEQRLLILDCWQRSGLPAGDFADLVGVSKHTLYAWKKAFTLHGPAGLTEQKRGVKEGSRLPPITQRSILMLKQAHPDWGCERISAMLLRGPALPASPSAVARVLHEAGYELEESPTRPHPDKVRSFERARPNQLWQTDLFTFVLKRQNRRVYLVAFLDDHSRFIVSFGLHASQSTALVLEVLRAGIASYGAPEEVLTDNGAQYVTWRGKSLFTRELEKRGIRQIVARPRRPQTLGKIERFWGTLWREFLEAAVFLDVADARTRIGHFIDWYNFQRPHSGVDYLAPADRFFGAAPDMLRVLRERVAGNALELARNGVPRPPFYVAGQVGGRNFSLHAEGERVFLTQEGEQRREVELAAPTQPAPLTPGAPAEGVLPQPVCPDGSPVGDASEVGLEGEEPTPGTSPLDDTWPPAPLGTAVPPQATAVPPVVDQGPTAVDGSSQGGVS